MRDCVHRIVEASRNQNGEAFLSDKEAKSLLDTINNEAAKKARDNGTDISDEVLNQIAEMKVTKKLEGQIQKRNAAINIIKRKELDTKMDALVAEGLTPRKAMQAILVGVQGVYKGGRRSIDAKFKAIQADYMGNLVGNLEKEGLMPIVHKKEMQPEIERELWALSEGKGGVTKSKEALQIAKIIHKNNEALRLRQNRAGAAIDKLEGFTVSQSHDRSAIRKAGVQAWKEKILPLLDKEKTFMGDDVNEFLDSTYEVLTTGISKKDKAAEGLFEFKGPSNLAKKASRSRVLHFKDADSSIEYRNLYGKRDFMEGVMLGIDGASRNVALMETLGTNPRAMFDKMLEDTRKKYRGDPEKVKGLENPRMLKNYYEEVDGSTLIPESPSLATIGSTIRAIQSMAKLGMALISSFSDIPIKASELQHQNFGFLESYGIAFSDIRLPSKLRKQASASLGVGMNGMTGSVAARWTSSDDLTGTASKLQRLFFKMNGLEWWTDSQKVGTGMAMSHRLATLKGLSFDKLDADTKRLFRNYDIDASDWESIRKAANKMDDGNEYITPDAIRDIEGLTAKQKEVLEDKLRAYFIDRADMATLTPDARERALLNQGLRRGTVEGEMLRFVMQFKSFPTTVLTKVYGRALYGKGKADIPALIQTAIMTTIMGYGVMVLKDLAKGREPRSLEDPKTWSAALLQGGGAGIMGDFLLGEYNRYGRDLVGTLAGPSFGMANDIAATASAAAHGDDASAKALQTLIANTPFANLFYIRPAINHMFLYQLQESMNPGYLRRMERRIEKENNQKFIIKPSSVVN